MTIVTANALPALVTLYLTFKQTTMKKNMGFSDRAIRLIAAAAFALLYFTGIVSGIFGIMLLALAAVFALTGFVSFCPLYLPFDINTKTNEQLKTNKP